MNDVEVMDLLMYLHADHDAVVTEEKHRVWCDLFQHVPIQTAREAAKIVARRKTYGVPKTSDFQQALEDMAAVDRLTWGEAWDLWVLIAHRLGSYQKARAYEVYKVRCPIGAAAIGTSYSEWFSLPENDVGTFRAQFRQRFEALYEREVKKSTMKELDSKVQFLVEDLSKKKAIDAQ